MNLWWLFALTVGTAGWVFFLRDNYRTASWLLLVACSIMAILRLVETTTPDRNPEGEKPQALSAKHESGLPEGSSI